MSHNVSQLAFCAGIKQWHVYLSHRTHIYLGYPICICRFNVTLADIPPFFTPFPYLCAGFEESVEKCALAHSVKCNSNNDSDLAADLVAVECNEPKATVSHLRSGSALT